MREVMTSRNRGLPVPGTPAGRWLLVAGLLVTVLAVGLALPGCGARAAKVALPGKAARAHRVRGKAAPASPRGLVLAGYEGYWHATSEALASGNAARARAILAGYVPSHAVPALVRGLQRLWRRHETGFGYPVFHILSVTTTGPRTAVVHDCLDLSHSGFQNEQTGQVVGGFGQSREFVITTLALEHGRWLVTGAIPVVRSCEY